MPSKIQLDENLWFLYICLQKSDLKSIDFAAVGLTTNLKPPAARMRYTRLRRQIESGTLIGTHGTPFSGATEKIAEAGKKRKRGSCAKADSEDEITGKTEASGEIGKRGGEGWIMVVKEEVDDRWSEFENSGSEADSEDEMPLAKLRNSKIVAKAVGTKNSAAARPGVGEEVMGMMAPLFPSAAAFTPYGLGNKDGNGGGMGMMQDMDIRQKLKPRQQFENDGD